MTLVLQISRIHCPVNFWSLEACARDFDIEEHLIEDLGLLVADMTLVFVLELLVNRLDGVPVGITCGQ